MTQGSGLELPKDVVTKIERVLGVPSSVLDGYDLVKLIEELCDTALMFDREERGTGQTAQQRSGGEAVDSAPPTLYLRRTRHTPDGQGDNAQKDAPGGPSVT